MHKALMRIVPILLAVVLVVGGGANLLGVPALHTSFAELGLPAWFGYLIGALEVASGVGLLIARLRVPAAAVTIVIMVGALYYHVSMRRPVEGAPALAILLLSAYVLARHSIHPQPAAKR